MNSKERGGGKTFKRLKPAKRKGKYD